MERDESGQDWKIAALSHNSMCTFFIGEKMIDKIIKRMKVLNKKALLNGDVPVSCVIIRKNEIIASAYNRKIKDNDPLAHAEILAIRKATKKTKTYNLNDCILYSTLIPCEMCKNIINEARIKKVYYLLENNKVINYTTEYVKLNNDKLYFEEELKSFFKSIR